MRVLREEFQPEAFCAALRRAERRALLLDYDGTLAPFQAQRDQAFPYPGVREALASLVRGGHTRVVIVSGRSCDDLLPLLGLDPVPEIWGTHGWERRLPDGRWEKPALDPPVAQALAEGFRQAVRLGAGAYCERKPASVALHWRGLDGGEASLLRERVEPKWAALARASGLELRAFDGGVELRAPGRDKGVAVNTVLAEMGEGVVAAYLGDDATDEDAFRAIAGRGMAVLVRPEWRPTAADVWIKPPDELLDFLAQWDRLAREGERKRSGASWHGSERRLRAERKEGEP